MEFQVGEVKLSEEHADFKWLSILEIKNLESMDKYFKEVLTKFKLN